MDGFEEESQAQEFRSKGPEFVDHWLRRGDGCICSFLPLSLARVSLSKIAENGQLVRLSLQRFHYEHKPHHNNG